MPQHAVSPRDAQLLGPKPQPVGLGSGNGEQDFRRKNVGHRYQQSGDYTIRLRIFKIKILGDGDDYPIPASESFYTSRQVSAPLKSDDRPSLNRQAPPCAEKAPLLRAL